MAVAQCLNRCRFAASTFREEEKGVTEDQASDPLISEVRADQARKAQESEVLAQFEKYAEGVR